MSEVSSCGLDYEPFYSKDRKQVMYLGETTRTWIRARTIAYSRGLTVDAMLDRYEKLDPTTYYGWREQFGILAEIYELQQLAAPRTDIAWSGASYTYYDGCLLKKSNVTQT